MARVRLDLRSAARVPSAVGHREVLNNLLSNLGGILNLYAGVTGVLIFEMFELLGHLFISWRANREERKKHEEEERQKENHPIKSKATKDNIFRIQVKRLGSISQDEAERLLLER